MGVNIVSRETYRDIIERNGGFTAQNYITIRRENLHYNGQNNPYNYRKIIYNSKGAERALNGKPLRYYFIRRLGARFGDYQSVIRIFTAQSYEKARDTLQWELITIAQNYHFGTLDFVTNFSGAIKNLIKYDFLLTFETNINLNTNEKENYEGEESTQ